MLGWKFGDPNALRVAAARFVSRTGGEAAFFVGIWGKAAYELNASPGEQALLMGSLGVFSLFGSAGAGVLIDRYDPRRVLMWSEVLFVPSALALVLPSTIGQMAAAVAVLALSSAAVMTAVASLPPFLTDDPTRLHRINGLVEAAGSLAFVAGPTLGALIVRFASLDWVFVLDAATSVVAVAVVAGVRLTAVSKRTRGPAFREVREGFRFSFASRPLRLYLGMSAAIWTSFGAFSALEPLFYRDVLGTGPEALGWVNAIFGIGILAGSVLLARLPSRFVSARSLIMLSLGSGLGAVIYTGTDNLLVVGIGAVYWGVILGALFPLLRTLIQLDAPESLIGRIMGTTNVTNQVGELLPLTFVPSLALAFGLQPVLVGSGLFIIAVASLTSGEGAHVDRVRTKAPVAPTALVAADERIMPNP